MYIIIIPANEIKQKTINYFQQTKKKKIHISYFKH